MVVDGASNGGRVAFKACAVNAQLRIVSIINGATDIADRDSAAVGGCSAVISKAAAFHGQRASIPNGAAEIGLVILQIDIVKGEVTLGARFVIAIENGTALVGGGIPGHSDIRNYSCTFIVQLGTLHRRKVTGEGAASERQLVLFCIILQRWGISNCNFDFSVDGRVVDSYADAIIVARRIVDVKSDSAFFSDDGGIIDPDVTMIVGHGVSAIS